MVVRNTVFRYYSLRDLIEFAVNTVLAKGRVKSVHALSQKNEWNFDIGKLLRGERNSTLSEATILKITSDLGLDHLGAGYLRKLNEWNAKERREAPTSERVEDLIQWKEAKDTTENVWDRKRFRIVKDIVHDLILTLLASNRSFSRGHMQELLELLAAPSNVKDGLRLLKSLELIISSPGVGDDPIYTRNPKAKIPRFDDRKHLGPAAAEVYIAEALRLASIISRKGLPNKTRGLIFHCTRRQFEKIRSIQVKAWKEINVCLKNGGGKEEILAFHLFQIAELVDLGTPKKIRKGPKP